MKVMQPQVTPYFGWTSDRAERWIISLVWLPVAGGFFSEIFHVWPRPLDIFLYLLLSGYFFCQYTYLIFRFTQIDEQQITTGWRIGWLGNFFKRTVTWNAVEFTEFRRDYPAAKNATLIITTRAGERLEFPAPAGAGTQLIHAIHRHYGQTVG